MLPHMIRRAVDVLLEREASRARVLLYFSSGRYHTDWEELPFDLAIMVDAWNSKFQVGPKFVALPMDNSLVARLLTALGIRAEALLAINDGCLEGGNYECLYGASGFGRLMPLLKEGCIVVTDHGRPRHWQPFHAEPCPHPGWSSRFPPSYCRPEAVRSYSLSWRPLPEVVLQAPAGRVRILHDTLWRHLDALDALILPDKLRESRGLHYYLASVPEAQHNSFLESLMAPGPELFYLAPRPARSILPQVYEALSRGHRRIGVLPNFRGNARAVVEEAAQADLRGIQDLTFFHLDPRDFRALRVRDCRAMV